MSVFVLRVCVYLFLRLCVVECKDEALLQLCGFVTVVNCDLTPCPHLLFHLVAPC